MHLTTNGRECYGLGVLPIAILSIMMLCVIDVVAYKLPENSPLPSSLLPSL